jgi:hypothetical protein
MQKRKLKVGSIVRLDWLDAMTKIDWVNDSNFVNLVPSSIRTCGYVVRVGDKALSVSTSIADKPQRGGIDAMDPVTIPWGCITKLRVVAAA